MTYSGLVVDGKIVLENGAALPNGSRVVVTTVDDEESAFQFLLKYVGKANDLPPDMAEQHDHYIHGTPKK